MVIHNIKYHSVKSRLIQAIGAQKVTTDPDILGAYSKDETSDLSAMPDIVVRAESAGDISNTMRICNEEKVPVIPRGAGTGVTGGAVPIKGGVVLSLEKMNRIIEIDRENMIAVVEPGVITAALQSAVLAEGLMYPPDPASMDSCTIGGNVAEIAGGPKAVKYGTTKDYVLGLEYVLPDGSVIDTGGKIVKNATGYNITGLLLGSEGTLAVITKIYLRLIPAPRFSIDLLIPFDTIDAAIDSVYRILINRIIPAAIEFMEKDAIDLVSKHIDTSVPFPDAGAHLLIQIDGNSEESVHFDLEKIAESLKIDAGRIIVAESAVQRERLWKARRSIRESLRAESPVFLSEDCVVPRSKIPVFMKIAKAFLKSKNLKSVMFGHAGDGNVHTDILKGDMDYESWKKIQPEIKEEIYRLAISLGGTITGEHGIGCTRKDYLSLALSREEIELLKRLKKAFDPNNILNPGKIFSE